MGSWLGCASGGNEVLLNSRFCQGGVQGVFLSGNLFLEVKYIHVHREIGSYSIRVYKNITGKKVDFLKGYRRATVRLRVPGQHEEDSAVLWELVLNHDNENVILWDCSGV